MAEQHLGAGGPPTTQEAPRPMSAKESRAAAKASRAHAKAMRPWYRKKRWWLLGAIALIVTLAVATGGGDDDTTSTSGGDDSGAQADGVEGQDTYALGETATTGDFEATVNTVEDSFTPTNPVEASPASGHRYVAVEATVTEGPRDFRTRNPLGFLTEARELGVKETSNVYSRVQGRSGERSHRDVSADRRGRPRTELERANPT